MARRRGSSVRCVAGGQSRCRVRRSRQRRRHGHRRCQQQWQRAPLPQHPQRHRARRIGWASNCAPSGGRSPAASSGWSRGLAASGGPRPMAATRPLAIHGLVFGLGDANQAQFVRVRWTDGKSERFGALGCRPLPPAPRRRRCAVTGASKLRPCGRLRHRLVPSCDRSLVDGDGCHADGRRASGTAGRALCASLGRSVDRCCRRLAPSPRRRRASARDVNDASSPRRCVGTTGHVLPGATLKCGGRTGLRTGAGRGGRAALALICAPSC